VLKKLPSKVNLSTKFPALYDQGELGSCTANAIGAAFQFLQKKQKLKDFIPSRLFIYYNERVVLGTINEDSGAMIRDGIKSMNKQGACRETMWPYKIEKFTEKPPQECYKEALKHQVTSYKRLSQNLNQLMGCLADGFPFVFGFTVYDSFMTQSVAKTGKMPMPDLSKESVQGGHAVVAVGYDDSIQCVIVRNSWGKNWGKGGHFMMPYAYIQNPSLCDDFWTMRIVEAS
jgi:C1A family cysteine protease